MPVNEISVECRYVLTASQPDLARLRAINVYLKGWVSDLLMNMHVNRAWDGFRRSASAIFCVASS